MKTSEVCLKCAYEGRTLSLHYLLTLHCVSRKLHSNTDQHTIRCRDPHVHIVSVVIVKLLLILLSLGSRMCRCGMLPITLHFFSHSFLMEANPSFISFQNLSSAVNVSRQEERNTWKISCDRCFVT